MNNTGIFIQSPSPNCLVNYYFVPLFLHIIIFILCMFQSNHLYDYWKNNKCVTLYFVPYSAIFTNAEANHFCIFRIMTNFRILEKPFSVPP